MTSLRSSISTVLFCALAVSCSSQKKQQTQESQQESWFSDIGKKEDLYFKTRKLIEAEESAVKQSGGQAKTVYKCDVQHPTKQFKFTYEASTLTGEDFLADLDCRVLSSCYSYFKQLNTPHECMQMTKQCFWEVTNVRPKATATGQSSEPFNSERRARFIEVGQGNAKPSQQRSWGRWGQGPGCTQYYSNTPARNNVYDGK
jgi:hypothetical protein